MASPNPFDGIGGAYIYDPVADEYTQVEAPTAPPVITPTSPPILTTTEGDLKIVVEET